MFVFGQTQRLMKEALQLFPSEPNRPQTVHHFSTWPSSIRITKPASILSSVFHLLIALYSTEGEKPKDGSHTTVNLYFIVSPDFGSPSEGLRWTRGPPTESVLTINLGLSKFRQGTDWVTRMCSKIGGCSDILPYYCRGSSHWPKLLILRLINVQERRSKGWWTESEEKKVYFPLPIGKSRNRDGRES